MRKDKGVEQDNKIEKRITELASYAKSIESGNYNTSIPDDILKSQDEIGELAKSIDNLKNQLKKSYEEIYNQNKVLENEIKERRKREENIYYLRNFDILTGLQQKSAFINTLNEMIFKARYQGKFMAIFIVGLDDFKFINEAMGYLSGDKLLVIVSQKLKAKIKNIKYLARIAGDEFAIVLDDIESTEEITDMAKNLLNVFSGTFIIDEREIYVTASIGISIYPIHGFDAETLIMNATSAENYVKKNGKSNYQIYAKEMNKNANKELEMIAYLQHALKKNEFVLHYQPQVSLSSGMITGFEALIRWNHPKLGLVYPDTFIPLAEKTGLILPISEWVIKEACMQNKKWHDKGNKDIIISVNLSPLQFKQENLSKKIKSILDDIPLDPKYLEIEITEGMLMKNVEQAVNVLNELKDIGLKVAIDDFGTGYSSLGYLTKFPIDRLKIDRSFITGIPNRDNGDIANTVIQLAKSLKLKVVAEGVETKTHLNFLKLRQCDDIQGYYFSKPLPVNDAEEMLKKNKMLM